MEPGVVWTLAVTPSFPFDRVPTDHAGMSFLPGFAANALLIALRCCVNTKDVPLESARTTTLIGVLGSFAPGFALAMAGSFHVFTLPKNIPGYASRDNLRALTPGTL